MYEQDPGSKTESRMETASRISWVKVLQMDTEFNQAGSQHKCQSFESALADTCPSEFNDQCAHAH